MVACRHWPRHSQPKAALALAFPCGPACGFMLGEVKAMKTVSCCQRSPLPKLSWAQGHESLPLPRESWAPCLESFLLPQALAGPLLQAERADPFSFLISMHSVISHGEVQSHLPRAGSGFTGWHHLSPEAHAPRPCRHMSSGLDEVELCWQWMPLSLPPLSLTVPWGFLFGRAGERWEAEEGHYGWAFHWLMEQIRLSLNGRSTQCFTLEYAVFKII